MSEEIRIKYCEEFLSEQFEEYGIVGTKEKIRELAEDIARLSFECLEYVPCDPHDSEITRLKKLLQEETNKETCRKCRGTGVLTGPVGTSHSYVSQCGECHGQGRC